LNIPYESGAEKESLLNKSTKTKVVYNRIVKVFVFTFVVVVPSVWLGLDRTVLAALLSLL